MLTFFKQCSRLSSTGTTAMKRCPTCKRDYFDDSLLYCLDDGSHLLEGPGQLPSAIPSELPTKNIAGPLDEPPTAVFRVPLDKQSETPHRQGLHGRWLVAAAAIVLLLAASAFYLYRRSSIVRREITSIAVLPLANLSGDPEQQYFADGVTEAVIGNLSQIRSIKVISRTSVMKYKNAGKTIPEIAAELGVDGIVEGSVQRSGERIRVTAQLIDVASDSPIWSNGFERQMSDILRLESEIAQEVAGEIRAQLTPAEQQRLGNSKSIDPRSAEAAMLGIHFFNMWTAESEQKAIEQFQKAVEIAPDYADAWAGLADSWTASAMNGNMRMSEAQRPTKNATDRALAIEPDNSAANVSMCFVKNNYDFDWVEGERFCRRGINLDPNNSKAHFAYAFMLARLERWDDMKAQVEEAMRVDPAQPWWPAVYADWLIQAHRYDDASKMLNRALEIDPNWEMTNYGRMNLSIALGKYDEALKLARSSGAQARIYAAMGDRPKALNLLKNTPDDQYTAARVYAALGDNNKAFEILNKSLDDGDGFMGPAASYTEFDKLHSDPRWKDILRRMNR